MDKWVGLILCGDNNCIFYTLPHKFPTDILFKFYSEFSTGNARVQRMNNITQILIYTFSLNLMRYESYFHFKTNTSSLRRVTLEQPAELGDLTQNC